MPPKAARGAGRGRGRGQGKAPAPPAAEQPSTSQLNTQNDIDSQSKMAASPPPEPLAPRITTPQNELLDYADPSPNSSPATVWTETPAPTPIRPPSTLRTGSSSSVLSATRGGIASRGSRVKTTESRFKPKNIRRDARELEELRKKERIRLDAIAAEETSREAWKARAGMGRGWGMRGRGDAMGRGAGRGRSAATASGIFGVVPEGLHKRPEFLAPKASTAGGSSRSGGSGPSGPKTVKTEGVTVSRGDYTSSGKTRTRDFLPDPQYPDEDLDAPRVDIEMINLISDDSDDEPLVTGSRKIPIGRGKSLNKGGLKPVRLHREEHKERVTLVNTEPTIKIQSDSEEEFPTIDELRSSRAPPKDKEFKGTYQDDEATRIKAEPDMEIELPYHGTPPPPESKGPAKDLTYSPEYKRKSKDQGESSAIDLDGKADGSVAKVKKDKKGRRLSKMKDKKPVIQTEEDRAEYERHLEDVAILANELGGLQGNLGAQSQDANGDVAMEDGDLEYRDKKEGRLYLFQFPPVLPELYNPTNAKPKTKAEIRAEKENEKAEKDVQMSGMSAKAKGKTKERIDLTRDATVVKVEEEVVLGPDGTPKKEEEKRKRDEVVHEEGWIGKLVVRESGKVELCWGGTNLVVGRGVDAGFLTTGVMVDMIEKGPPGGGAPEGKALSMGKVMGKFVVTPDWEKMV